MVNHRMHGHQTRRLCVVILVARGLEYRTVRKGGRSGIEMHWWWPPLCTRHRLRHIAPTAFERGNGEGPRLSRFGVFLPH